MSIDSTPSEPQLTEAELLHLIRQGDPPLTRREIRQRDAAVEAGLLIRDDEGFSLAQTSATPSSGAARPTAEPPVITSADVLAGNVPAASGLTRRQLREIAQQQEQAAAAGIAEPEVAVTPALASAPEMPSTGTPVQAPGRRPIVRPEGATTGEYTGQFEPIREALATTGSLPQETKPSEPAADAPAPAAPQRRSIFQATIPPELNSGSDSDVSELTDTNAADLSSVIDMPVVTDNLIPDVTHDVSGEPEPLADEMPPVIAPASEPTPKETGRRGRFPDWHTLTALPRLDARPSSDSSGAQTPPVIPPATRTAPASYSPQAARQEPLQHSKPVLPLWLVVLQWLVIVVVAVVLGLLVWYAINMGFSAAEDAEAGIFSPVFYLRI